jgi:hypothetical protein
MIQVVHPDPDFLPIPEPRSRGHKDRHRIQDPDPQHWQDPRSFNAMLYWYLPLVRKFAPGMYLL